MNRLNERLALIVVVLLLILARQSTPEFQVGDILFQDLDCGPPCEAIEAVTSGYNGAQLSHNGIITEIKGEEFSQIFVVEAIGESVVKTPLNEFLERNDKVIVGRVKSDYTYMISDAINYIESSILGKPYDYIFDLDNDTYYCSEVIYKGFEVADSTQNLFAINPMTFNEPNTNDPFVHWVSYYKELNAEIPEGELGLNPGGMSRSNKIDIIYTFKKPSGMQ
ncbi:MAG: YiiX/YebB-like N1pC/P60 family cysteine hydrolase [Candidatus Neomarinimicrobiota bacterium]|nr:YiiX/YebB-like N1pC/P60 family cysteine hydrolase [Candidatus Neomarinimicrobiota bacterium]